MKPKGQFAPSSLAAAWSGLLAALAAGIFIAPFGALTGVIAAENGFSVWQALGLSMIVFAGAAQLATMELMSAGAPWLIIVVSALAVNLRFLLYSGTLAPLFASLSSGRKLAAAAMTVDNSVSALLSWRRFAAAEPGERYAFFVACGLGSWMIWQMFTVVGHQFGPLLDARALGIVAPVAFMALAAPLLTNRPRWAAALIAAAAAVLLKGKVYHLDLMLAVLLGVGASLAIPSPAADSAEPELADASAKPSDGEGDE